MTAAAYLDTSALAKWYLNEPNSDTFEAFVRALPGAAISRLTTLEFRCLLTRRRRVGDITSAIERRVFSSFENDIRAGFLDVHPLEDHHVVAAAEVVNRLSRHALRSLDALHLAIAMELKAGTLATADRIMADTAAALGFKVARFN